jgi:hypothetical protein
MLSDFLNTAGSLHDEYLRRHSNHPAPLERPRHGLRQTIGKGLIHLGEFLAEVERHPRVDQAA